MSRNVLSALAIFAAGSLIIGWKKFFGNKETLIERRVIKRTLILLRKRFFSTLREVAFVVKHLKTHQGFSSKKVAQILMYSGSSAQLKLNAIQQKVLRQNSIQKRLDFQFSCLYYGENDIEIKILLDILKMDLEMALDGNMSQFDGPLPEISHKQAIQIYRQILKRRMDLIKKKHQQHWLRHTREYQDMNQRQLKSQQYSQMLLQSIQIECQIEQYLQIKGIKDEKQPSQKLFLAIVQRKCLQSSDFQLRMMELQLQLQQCMCLTYFSYQNCQYQTVIQKFERNNELVIFQPEFNSVSGCPNQRQYLQAFV